MHPKTSLSFHVLHFHRNVINLECDYCEIEPSNFALYQTILINNEEFNKCTPLTLVTRLSIQTDRVCGAAKQQNSSKGSLYVQQDSLIIA